MRPQRKFVAALFVLRYTVRGMAETAAHFSNQNRPRRRLVRSEAAFCVMRHSNTETRYASEPGNPMNHSDTPLGSLLLEPVIPSQPASNVCAEPSKAGGRAGRARPPLCVAVSPETRRVEAALRQRAKGIA